MNGRVLLDSNIIIAFFARDPSVEQHFKATTEIFLPSIVLGELFYGARKSSKIKDNVEKIEDFASANNVLSCDLETARQYGILKEFLRSKGRPIPENDIWIAALSRQYSLRLISRDTHFDDIDGVELERW